MAKKEKIVCCGNCIYWPTNEYKNPYGEKCSNMFSCQWCKNHKRGAK